MHLDELHQKLIQAARLTPPSDHVPYAFEKRVMKAVAALPPIDAWALWSSLLWRAAAPCIGIMLVVGIWSVVAGHNGSSTSLAADLERTVWAPLTSLNDSW